MERTYHLCSRDNEVADMALARSTMLDLEGATALDNCIKG